MNLVKVEWPTVVLIMLCYGSWLLLMLNASFFHPVLWILLIGILLTFFWSLIHESIHGHPTRLPVLNHALMFFPIGWVYSWERFRETHIEHHEVEELTDPLDDPESFYLALPDWTKANPVVKAVLKFNNTLCGRLLIGPAISVPRFYINEIKLMLKGDAAGFGVAKSWALHLIGAAILIIFLANYTNIPIWQHAIAAYMGVSFLLIRTFLEHQACEKHGERTVIIEQPCPIAFLFLFNSLHAVHHTKPGLPWYKLLKTYRGNREYYIRENNGYVYNSYAEIFRRYFFRAKEPIPHPFLRTATNIQTERIHS